MKGGRRSRLLTGRGPCLEHSGPWQQQQLTQGVDPSGGGSERHPATTLRWPPDGSMKQIIVRAAHCFSLVGDQPAMPPGRLTVGGGSCGNGTPLRSGAYRVFTRERVFLIKSSETPSVRPSASASICGKTVEELRERPQELVAYFLQGDPQAGTEKNLQLSRATRSQSP